MSHHLAFVVSELAPITRGGAGSLVAELRSRCLGAGMRVSIVLAADITDQVDRHVVIARGNDDAGWDLPFMATSKAAADALAELHARDPVDQIEIQDFDGLAFWALTHRHDLGIADVPVSVRFHGPVDLQTEAMGHSTPELDAVAAMEREAFAMADRVVVPSRGIGSLVADRYDIDDDRRIVVGSPPVRRLDPGVEWSGGTDLLVIGRLSEVKGSQDFVDAAIPVLRRHPELTATFAGADGWSASAHRPMIEWLSERIPSDVADRIAFPGDLDRHQLAERIAACRAVVVPSRFESFNLAAHEARLMGAPVVVPDLAAFSGLLDDETGAVVYDGSVEGLTSALDALADDGSLAERIAAQVPPAEGDPLAPYVNDVVDPRHLRSQGGLATAALARVEAVWLEPRRRPPPASAGRRLLQVVPQGLFDAAKKVVPNSIKDRLRRTTDWGAEADRRTWEDRFSRGVARMGAMIAGGGTPKTSVVMPCYNQGSFVREALLSIFEQTADGFEVIIVDDGSDDGTTTPFLRSLDIPGVRVIHQANRGLSSARNVGIAESAAEFVITLDADDQLHPAYLESLLGALERTPSAAYAHCWAELFGDTHQIWATRPFNRYQLLLSNSVVGCVLMRRQACVAVGGYDESMRSGNEDWDLWIRLMAAGYDQTQVREPLFRYRKHGVSMSVETESRYEDALRDRVERNPALYARDTLEELKAAAYPLVTVITEDPHILGEVVPRDMQLIAPGDRPLSDVVDGVTGKYVVVVPAGAEATYADVFSLCSALEEAPDAGAAHTSSDEPVVVVRSWSLFDPDGPATSIRTDIPGSAPGRLSPGQFPREGWTVPRAIASVPVLRQRPEEAGLLPSWVPT